MALQEVFVSEFWKYHQYSLDPDPAILKVDRKRFVPVYHGDKIPEPFAESVIGAEPAIAGFDPDVTPFLAFAFIGLWISGGSIFARVRLDTRYWPSWRAAEQSWDLETGEWQADGGFDYDIFDVYQAGDGAGKTWTTDVWGDCWNGGSALFAGIYPPFFIDEPRDILVSRTQDARGICIYRLDGTLVTTLRLHGSVVDLFRENGTRGYAVSDSGLFWLFDYATAEWLGVFSSGFRAFSSLGGGASRAIRFCWDAAHQRILCIENTANDEDGNPNLVVRGYLPVPVADQLTTPIPLAALRKGRRVPIYVRAIDRSGAGISALSVTLTPQNTANGDVTVRTLGTDRTGAARFPYRCDAAGSSSPCVAIAEIADLSIETDPVLVSATLRDSTPEDIPWWWDAAHGYGYEFPSQLLILAFDKKVNSFYFAPTISAGGHWDLNLSGGSGPEWLIFVRGNYSPTLTIAIYGREVAAGETGTLDYAGPANGAVQDAWGHPLQAIDDFSVTNEIAP